MRVYICPNHPEKPYSSWRKFRGHWSTQHRGEECPPRDEFLQEVGREEFLEKKKEYKEELKEDAGKVAAAAEAITAGEFVLPEEPAPRLAKILEVHGVSGDLIAQILGIFQLHPGYRENPTNLHYLLTAKLPRKFHPSIPMMTSAFVTQEGSYPEGIPFGMASGGMGQGAMPPFMYGGGYPPYYPPTFGYAPTFRPPAGGREEVIEERGRGRAKESNPVGDAVALLGTLMELRDKLMPSQEGNPTSVQEIFEGFRSTIEEVTKENKNQQDALLDRMDKMQEVNTKTLEGIKEQFHQAEKSRLQDRIDTLEEMKDEERSDGLGTLLKEAGEGVGTQVDGLRQSITQGVDKIGTIAEQMVRVERPSPIHSQGAPLSPKTPRTVVEASKLLEAESAVEEIAKRLERS